MFNKEKKASMQIRCGLKKIADYKGDQKNTSH